jgi:protein-tyrosine phosphatase
VRRHAGCARGGLRPEVVLVQQHHVAGAALDEVEGGCSSQPAGTNYDNICLVDDLIDLHTHILPDIDDGVATMEEASELARRAAADGVTAIAATPHVRDDYPTTPVQMESAVTALRGVLRAAGIPVEILPGGEIALDRLDRLDRDELLRFSLAQSRRYLLIEFPYVGWPLALETSLWKIRAAGLAPVIGHPERNREVQERPDRLAPVVAAGALVQITAASLDGRLGPSSRAAARALLKDGNAHVLASDAHGAAIREAGLADAVAALADADLARYLTEDVPAAIVAGDPIPVPPVRRTRGLLRRRA